MNLTFRNGAHPPAKKELTENIPLKEMPTPDEVAISLSQHIGAPAQPVVQVGDEVKAGTLIGRAAGFVSSNIYSSVSGTVKGFKTLPTANGGKAQHVVIENDGLYRTQTLPLVNPTKENIVARVQEAGIVGMGGATFPTHVKLSPSKPVDTLIINAAECEPYITCDYRLLIEETTVFIKGVEFLMKALGVKKAYIGIEKNKPDAIRRLISYCPFNIVVKPLKVKYPQGAEKQLIYAITKRKVPAGGLPMDVGCVVDNVHTAYSIAQAVLYGEPCYRRAMTISGRGIHNPGNYWVRNGVSFRYLLDQVKGGEPYPVIQKVISGGPMMGFAQVDLDPCTTKGSSSLLFMVPEDIEIRTESPCINCARCAMACPMMLMPMFIEKAVLENDAKAAKDRGALNCIECGCCAYECPAKRPLVQAMRMAKRIIKEKGV